LDSLSGKLIATVIDGSTPGIRAIAITPNDTLLVCLPNSVRRYGFGGESISTLIEGESFRACTVANNVAKAAVLDHENVFVFDLNSNTQTHVIPSSSGTALAFSPDGRSLAVGDARGKVSLIDPNTGAIRWSSNPPGRFRWPWTLPTSFALVWVLVAWRLSKGARP
jgi:WD40 repeat protein